MWPDNQTEDDFLNFSGVAETVAEIVIQAHGRPISIGVSGAWGVGKSSMIGLIRNELKRRDSEGKRFLFVDFDAWLYQGYDDARAALMDVIGQALEKAAIGQEGALDKTKDFLNRIDWLRTAKFAGSLISAAAGLPPLGLIDQLGDIAHKMTSGENASQEVDKLEGTAEKLSKGGAGGFLKPKTRTSPPKEIHALRESFRAALKELKVTLVVLIDDLDRCLPETTISTLEAIRLFLFLEDTAFVIAADDRMIKYAVKRHFPELEDDADLATNYFDKLIQVPIRVPHLGTQEVRAYMMLLYVQNSTLSLVAKEKIRAKVGEQLRNTWKGKRVDLQFVQSLGETLPPELIVRLESADRLASIMTTATNISGNPRLIKRFLNALAIRMTISGAHHVSVDEAVLAKMLLFERCGNPKAYEELAKSVTEDEQGKPTLIAQWEKDVVAGKELNLKEPWSEAFIKEWLALPPQLRDLDLRGVLYVSREHAPLISPEDRLSSNAAGLLNALLDTPDLAASLKGRLSEIPRQELSVIMGRLLERAKREQEWGVPKILEACLVVADIDASQESRLAAFLQDRPSSQITPAIVPKIGSRAWAKPVLQNWAATTGVDKPVKNAITKLMKT